MNEKGVASRVTEARICFMKILILTEQTSNDRKALAALRSLSHKGHEVSVACDTAMCSAFWSRYIRGRIICPSPITQPQAYVIWLLKKIRTDRPDLLLPISDYTTLIVAENKKELSRHTRFVVPPVESFHLAHDKLELMHIAQSIGLHTPPTYCCENREKLLSIAREVSYPCVFKLRKGAGAIGLAFPEDADTLVSSYDALGTYGDDIYDADKPLIQEFIPGPIHDVCTLFYHGSPVAALTQVRQIMHPARGGVGIYNVTTKNKEVLEKATALLKTLNWHGPAMVEFKQDSRDGHYKLIEINPRFWGTLDLSIQAGMDFPNLLSQLATGSTLSPTCDYRIGTCYRWAFPYLFKGSIPPRKWQDTWKLLRFDSKAHSEFRFRDPLPGCAKIATFLAKNFQKLKENNRKSLETDVING